MGYRDEMGMESGRNLEGEPRNADVPDIAPKMDFQYRTTCSDAKSC